MKFKKILKKFLGKNNLQPTYNDDIFVISYPKSGNTWTRFVLSHLLTKCKEQLNFKNCDHIIPDYDVHHDLVKELKQRPRIMKSHKSYQKNFSKVIYIIRDPRDVYVSYFHYISKKLPKKMTFQDFLRNKEIKGTWENHIKSWEKCENKILLKYEDMLNNPINEFNKVIDFTPEVGWDEQFLEKAVEMSSFKNMKKVEKEFGRNFLSKEAEKKSSTFMRKGIKGDWVNYFNEDDLAYLKSEAGDMMAKYGYTFD